MNLIKWVKEKTEMKLVIWTIERVFKNWITTALGLLLGFCAVVASTYNLIPSTLVWNGYPVADTLLKLAGIALAIAGAIAKDKHIGINPPVLPDAKLPIMLLAFALTALTIGAAPVRAQTPIPAPAPAVAQNMYAAGLSYNNGVTPALAGNALYCRSLVADGSTCAFALIDILPVSAKPFTVTTNVGVGIGQRVFSINDIKFFMPTGAGVTVTGTNTGWNWTSGIVADYPIKKNGVATSWHLLPHVRFLKASVGGADYQLIGGVDIGLTK